MNPDSILFRQVHPSFIPNGELSSQAFMPFPKDNGKLSLYDGDQISATDSYRHYTTILCNESHSVWGVTVPEVNNLQLTAISDPQEDFPSHSLIDFTQRPSKEYRKLAKLLRNHALHRGCIYQPTL